MSDPLPVPSASNTFERIRRTNEHGAEFWSARELARVLEYADFRNFIVAMEKAREACARSGHTVADHFVDITEMVGIGSGAQRALKIGRFPATPVISSSRTRTRANRSSRSGRPTLPCKRGGRNWRMKKRRRRAGNVCCCGRR
jgi:hypothetical protein